MSTISSPKPPRSTAYRRVRAAALAAGFGLSLLGGASLLWAPVVGAQTAVPAVPAVALTAPSQQLQSFAPLVKKVMPAVVNISVVEKAGSGGDTMGDDGPTHNFPRSPFDDFLRRFFEQQQGGMQGNNDNDEDGGPYQQQQAKIQRMALGSGFIIDPSGYVVTNNHVVGEAEKVTVVFQDNSKHAAKIIGRDAKTDLALLKIDAPQPLPYVNWGDSDALQVGDWVLAVGNPFGLGGTVSSGIISARGRDIHSGPYDDFLQIDAAINRGNSGGPTFNLNGGVIGINTAIYSPNGGSVGIGFAIPASLAKPVIDQLRAHGSVERGWLGVQIQDGTPELAKSLNLPTEHGALVADVTAGGPAAKAGFKQGDVIEAFNGHDIGKVRDLPIMVAGTPVGQKAPVKVWRNGSEQTIDATIGTMPENPEMAMNGNGGEDQPSHVKPERTSAMGLKLAPLNESMRARLHIQKEVKGVVVTGISESSPLNELGIQPGDVIVAVNQQPVVTPGEAAALLKAPEKGQKNLLLLLNRHGVNQYVALSPEGSAG